MSDIKATWTTTFACTPGRSHLRRGIPCQDAAGCGTVPRPFAVACDGKGSAELSHEGSSAAVQAVKNQLTGCAALFKRLLDDEGGQSQDDRLDDIASMLHRSTALVQQQLAESAGRSPKDYEFTLLCAILGKRRAAFFQIGDGAIIIETGAGLGKVFDGDHGEYANVTKFVRFHSSSADMRRKLMPIDDIRGVAVFSDGVEDRMIERGTGNVAPHFSEMFRDMRAGKLDNTGLHRFLTEEFWEPAVQDDRCMAMLAFGSEASQAEIPVPAVHEDTITPVVDMPPEPAVAAPAAHEKTLTPIVDIGCESAVAVAAPKRNRLLLLLCAAILTCQAFTLLIAWFSFDLVLAQSDQLIRVTGTPLVRVREVERTPPPTLTPPVVSEEFEKEWWEPSEFTDDQSFNKSDGEEDTNTNVEE